MARGRFDEALTTRLEEGAVLAFLLTGDERNAPRLARDAMVHALRSFADLRFRGAFDEAYDRAILHVCRRVHAFESGSPIWTGYGRLRWHQRVAMALRYGRELPDETIADLLRCSSGRVHALHQSAASTLAGISGLGPEESCEVLKAEMEKAADEFSQRHMAITLPKGRVRLWRLGVGVAVTACLVAGAVVLGDVAPEPPRQERDLIEDAREDALQPFVDEPEFNNCPAMAGSLPPGKHPTATAGPVALQFLRAAMNNDRAALDGLVDGSAADAPMRSWARTLRPRGLHVTGSSPVLSDHPVISACGRSVAFRSWKVYLADSTSSNSEGVAIYLLIRRPDGWKVWGSEEPLG